MDAREKAALVFLGFVGGYLLAALVVARHWMQG